MYTFFFKMYDFFMAVGYLIEATKHAYLSLEILIGLIFYDHNP